MILGKIVGSLVSTQKDEKLTGLKFFLVKKIDADGNLKDDFVVAADSVGAGVDEVVLFVGGSSARQTSMTDGRPVDATIMAIVDTYDVDGTVKYKK